MAMDLRPTNEIVRGYARQFIDHMRAEDQATLRETMFVGDQPDEYYVGLFAGIAYSLGLVDAGRLDLLPVGMIATADFLQRKEIIT